MSVYHHIRQLVAQEFFYQIGLIFLENGINWISFVFIVLPNTHQNKIKSQM